MENFKYLIIGGGIAADSAVKGIRKKDETGTMGLISKEEYPPYDRPPLSKGLWKGEKEETIWRKTKEHNVKLFLSGTAKTIDVRNKIVADEKGESYSYDKLLIATGGKVNRLSFNAEGINYYRTFNDYRKLRGEISRGQNFVVIGGGFIGSEVAAALAMNGKTVTMVFPGDAIGEKVYPIGVSKFLNHFFEQKGVTVLNNDGITDIKKEGPLFTVKTKSGKTIIADGVVAGLGIKPDIELAQSAGLKINNGITVNEYLQTSEPDIYAAGDCANYYDFILGKNRRVEHENNSNLMGNIAGENMAGGKIKYDKLPFFYSDLFELGYEAVGELDSGLETVEQWKEPFKEGVLYYLDNKRVAGVLLWNTWNQVDNARALIAEKATFNKINVLNTLPK